MPFQGLIKSMGRDYGFVHCDETFGTYQRDVFINKEAVGVEVYQSMQSGSNVSFDVQLDAKGQPQAMNIVVTSIDNVAAHQAANPPKPRFTAPRGQFQQQAPMQQQQQYQPQAQGMSMIPPPWMPAAASAVTLHGTAGWFIPAHAIGQTAGPQPQYQQPQFQQPQFQPQGVKRGAGMMGGGGGGDFKRPGPPVPNPGLDPSEQVYTGVMKGSVNPKTGYGFIQCDDVFAAYAKDTFLHSKLCPWLNDMGLQAGETVQFNLVIDQKGQPQAGKCVRA